MQRRRLAAVLAPWLMLGCVTEDDIVDDLAFQFCETRWVACGCEGPGVTKVACESAGQREGNEAQNLALDAGLEFDRNCAKRWLERMEPNCASTLDGSLSLRPGACYPDQCSIYHGYVGKGEPCTKAAEWSDCAQGLVCGLSELCEDPCDGMRRGDVCSHGDYVTGCVGELVCTADGTCGDPPTEGERCSGTCARGLHCDYREDPSICVVGGKTGDECSAEDRCGSGFQCTEGVCEPAPAAACSFELPW